MGHEQDLLKEGDIIMLQIGDTVLFEIPAHFLYGNRVGVFNEVSKDAVVIGNHKGLNTEFLAGEYVVIKTAMDGGGTGHGDSDSYPDGHHVWCEKMFDWGIGHPGILVDFFQTGCFTAMLKDRKPTGKAELTWKKV